MKRCVCDCDVVCLFFCSNVSRGITEGRQQLWKRVFSGLSCLWLLVRCALFNNEKCSYTGVGAFRVQKISRGGVRREEVVLWGESEKSVCVCVFLIQAAEANGTDEVAGG